MTPAGRGERHTVPPHAGAPARAEAMARVARMSLSLPDATVRPAHGSPAYQIRGKTFCTVMDDHHGSGRTELWIKGAPGAQREWVLADSGKYYVPAYVGPTGWIGAWLDVAVDWPAIAELLVEGYLIQCGPKAAAAHDPRALAAGVLATSAPSDDHDDGDSAGDTPPMDRDEN